MEKTILQYHYECLWHRGNQGSVTQKPISARINLVTLLDMEQEELVSGMKRNTLINAAVKWYLSQLDHERRNKAHNVYTSSCTSGSAISIVDAIRHHLDTEQWQHLEHIRRQLQADQDETILRLLEFAIREYNNKPFTLL